MADRRAGKSPMPTTMTPKSAVARAKPRSGGRFTPAGKTITAASVGCAAAGAAHPQTGGKSGIAQYYNSGKTSSEGRVRKPLPQEPPATPTKGGGAVKRQYTGGKFVPGYSPQGFGSGPRATNDSESEEDDDDEEEEEAEVQPEAQVDEDDSEYDEYGVKIKKELKLGEADSDFQPDDEYEDVNDEGDLGIASIEDFVPARGRGAHRGRGYGMVGRQGSRTEGGTGNYSNGKIHYKKKIRKDSSRFTTTTAMIDADDEFHPKVAAFMGRKIVGTGNGRSAGRKLIRWTPATDQLLLLCFHHELAMMREDLPYEQVAERMFPEKCATGGAVKERFAKLRIEMLNRGSWVPPIIGKSPQGIRPNVRGVVRVAPGVDKGRYVLWKEDASKLIDPKDINKGYSLAQSKGQEYPPRVWISNEAKGEFYTKKRELEQKGLKPLATLPVDYAEDEEIMDASGSDRRGSMEEEQYNEDEDMEDEETMASVAPIATPNRKRKMQGAPTPSAKRSVAKARRQSARKPVSHEDDDDDVFGPGAGDGSPMPQPRQTRRTPANARPMAAFRSMAPSPEGNLRGGDTGNKMMSFDKDEKAVPARRVVILTRIPSRVLAKFPGGQQGPGTDKYYLDEVKDRVWVGEKNTDVGVVAKVEEIKVDKDLPDILVDSPDHFLFNSGITPPSDVPFWKATMEIHELVALADKVVAEETRPADILMQVFDGQRFWTVADVIEEFKANTNPETGNPKDLNVWYQCATILRHATQGDQYEDAKLLQANPMAQQNQQFIPDQNAMIDVNANVGFNPVQQNYDLGFVDNGNQSFQNMLHSGVGNFQNFDADGHFVQNDTGMNINHGMNNMYKQASFQGQNMQMQNMQNMFPAGDMNMGGMDVGMDMTGMNMAGMNNFAGGVSVGNNIADGMGNFQVLQSPQALQSPAPEMSIEEMNQFTAIPDGNAAAGVSDRDADGETVVDSPNVKDEAASPAPKPDIEMP